MTETSNSSSAAAKPIRQQGQSRAPFFWGAVACLIFYGALPFMPVQQDFLLRYCCSHPLEYVTIGLFFIGMSTLAFRGFDLSRETSALEDGNDLLLRCKKSSQNQKNRMEFLKKGLLAGSSRLGQSLTGRRIEEAVNYLDEVGDSEQLDRHLKHSAELEMDRFQQSLGLVNTISWAIPIVGFLGTVMGITIAIANVSPEQLDQSLGEVTSGLGVAFDTTALSLSLSLLMVFTTYWVRSRQDDFLNSIEELIDRQLAILFHSSNTQSTVEDHAAISTRLIEASERVVAESTAIWRETLSGVQSRMLETLAQEQEQFLGNLKMGIAGTIDAQREHQEELNDLQRQRVEQRETSLDESLSQWGNAFTELNLSMKTQMDEQREQTQLLQSVIDAQHELTILQGQIREAINTREITETLDQTLNSLTAAIQLLNARTSSHRAA